MTAANDFLQAREFHRTIGESQLANCTVVRQELETEIPVSELVAGDIVRIKTGMSVPADGILLESYGIKADESSVTGESDLVVKRADAKESEHGAPFLLAGTKVEEGAGTMLVCLVGEASTQGQLRSLGGANARGTPLQEKLSHISNVAAVIGMASAVLVFVVLFLHTIWDSGKRKGWDAESWEQLTDALMTVVAILVVAVPEGLPLAVTLTLAYSVGKMKEEKNLVRHLRACETMGAVDEVCTDKTGTLTLNKMQVVGSYFLDSITVNQDDREFNLEDEQLQLLFLQNFCLNSDASIVSEHGRVLHRGNRTDCALLALSLRWKCDYVQMRRKYPVVTRVPFSSKLKWMGTVVQVETGLRAFVKGAAEQLLQMCTKVYDGPGDVKDLTQARKNKLEREVVVPFTARPLRTIAVAYKEVSSIDDDVFKSNFILIGIFGIEDGVRSEAPAAVNSLQEANITVRMVTGDSLHTAISVAKYVGILPEEQLKSRYTVMEGEEFQQEVATADGMEIRSMDAFARVARDLRVLARCSPTQKYLLICGLRALGSVVAVTGDGCNDAPALRQADVGFAMNIVGTEVAKEAADIILLDDNFASIVTAVRWGRHIYDSIRRFIQFQLTASATALLLCLIGAMTNSRSPLAPVQMLWVNMIVDTFAAAAFNAEPPAASLLTRPPHVKGEPLLTMDMKKTMLVGVTYQVVLLTVLLFLGPTLFPLLVENRNLHFTLIFHTYVLMQLCHEFCCRSLTRREQNPCGNIWRNCPFLGIMLLTLIGQFSIVHFGG